MIRRAAVVSVRLGRRLSRAAALFGRRGGPVRGQKVMIRHGRVINVAGLRSAVKSPLRTLRRVRPGHSLCLLKSALSDGPRVERQHAPLTSRVVRHRSGKRRRTPVFGLLLMAERGLCSRREADGYIERGCTAIGNG